MATLVPSWGQLRRFWGCVEGYMGSFWTMLLRHSQKQPTDTPLALKACPETTAQRPVTTRVEMIQTKPESDSKAFFLAGAGVFTHRPKNYPFGCSRSLLADNPPESLAVSDTLWRRHLCPLHDSPKNIIFVDNQQRTSLPPHPPHPPPLKKQVPYNRSWVCVAKTLAGACPKWAYIFFMCPQHKHHFVWQACEKIHFSAER